MSEEIGLIYLNLSQLLDDICVFLRDGVNKEVFSAESQKKAETLIKRSKIQLQQISNITNGECYMQMEEQNHQVEEAEEEELIYMDAEEENIETPEDNGVCPFAGQSVRDLHIDDKCGFIYMKTKFIFGFEKLKRVYAAIHKDWFMIYCNDKDAKPSYTYCLRVHKAHLVPTTKQGEHETQLFLLVHSETKQKWQFIAQTHKDMLQWITRINKFHQIDDRQPNETKKIVSKIEKVPEPEVSTKNESEIEDEEDTYDMVVLKVNEEKNIVKQQEEDDEIYEVIRPQSPDKNSHIPIPKPSDISTLPTRRQQTPLPPLPVERKESSESLASYDNLVSVESWEKNSKLSETPSFSDDEEQEIYDVLIMTSQADQESEGEISPPPLPSPKKEETLSPLISSLKEKLLQSSPVKHVKEKPIPPKKLPIGRNMSHNFGDSTRKGTPSPVTSPMRKPLNSVSSNHSPTSPTSKSVFSKPSVQPKPSFLTKPKIDVKLIKPPANAKSTKQVMKLAKEISLK